jgi:hypothetical protein
MFKLWVFLTPNIRERKIKKTLIRIMAPIFNAIYFEGLKKSDFKISHSLVFFVFDFVCL